MNITRLNAIPPRLNPSRVQPQARFGVYENDDEHEQPGAGKKFPGGNPPIINSLYGEHPLNLLFGPSGTGDELNVTGGDKELIAKPIDPKKLNIKPIDWTHVSFILKAITHSEKLQQAAARMFEGDALKPDHANQYETVMGKPFDLEEQALMAAHLRNEATDAIPGSVATARKRFTALKAAYPALQEHPAVRAFSEELKL